MPWYRIFANHGPGHQSSSEHYRFFAEPLRTKEQKKEAWEEIFASYDYDWPIGDVELVEKLPQHIHDQQVESFKRAVEHGHRMLDILANTKTKPVIAVRMETEVIGINTVNGGNRVKTAYQARLLADEKVKGKLKPTREKAAAALIRQLKGRKADYAVIIR